MGKMKRVCDEMYLQDGSKLEVEVKGGTVELIRLIDTDGSFARVDSVLLDVSEVKMMVGMITEAVSAFERISR